MSVIYLMKEGSHARKDGGRLIIEKDGEKVGSIPLLHVDSIVIGRNAQMTTQSLCELAKENVQITFMDRFGHICGTLSNERLSLKRLEWQLACFHDEEICRRAARYLLEKKLGNQYELLRKYLKNPRHADLRKSVITIAGFRKTLSRVTDIDKMRGLEGMAAKLYFQAFGTLMDQDLWEFKGREHPAKDPVNALLNFGYSFLEKEVRIALAGARLDPRIGFVHANNDRKDSLVYDVMEIFRQPITDRFILRLINLKKIKPEDFKKGKTVTLSPEARSRFLLEYETFMTAENKAGQTLRDEIRRETNAFAVKLLSLYKEKMEKERSEIVGKEE